MKLIYTAGPYSGDVERNIFIARSYAIRLWGLGYGVICPHTNSAYFDEVGKVMGVTLGYETFMAGDIEMVKRCDAIFLLPNWGKSAGAVREWEAAVTSGKQVITYHEFNSNPLNFIVNPKA